MINFLLKKQVYGLIILILLGIIFSILSKFIIGKLLFKQKDVHKKRKAKTYVTLFQKIAKAIIWLVVLILILQLYGFDVKTFVAGLGIVSVIIGLALQDVLKDILGGITILADDFYSIGDIITLNDFTGEVIDFSLRTTKIVNFNNEVKSFTNRNISAVINHTKKDYIFFLDFNASYENNINTVENTFKKIIKKMQEKYSNINIEFLGIEKLDDSSIKYRLQVSSKYSEQYKIKREINKIVKEEFDKESIKIPYFQVEVHDDKII